MWEAFLLQMDEFDRFLEIGLRELLDPVVATEPPTRRGRRESRQLILAVAAPAIELAVETIAVAEPVVPARTL